LICERICIPVNADLRLTLDPGAARPSAHGALIGRYLARVPKSGGDAPFRIEAAKVSGPAGEQVLEVTARADQAFENPDMMVEAPSPFGFGRSAISYQEDRRLLTMRLPVYPGPGKAALSKHSLTLTLVDGARASETRITLGD
jgi:suppressor for copper-sensitivity B